MSLYRITPDKLESVPETTFAAEDLLECRDLQRLLRENISVLAKESGEDLMVIAEEFSNWQNSKRRIDLLCLSKDAGLVVVELKRDENGGHSELQALRYAAMVSAMTLDQAIQTYAKTMGGDLEIARKDVFDFLGMEEEDEPALSGLVKILLVAADFSIEITTSVLWLNRQGLKISCIRARPYDNAGSVMVDITQILPLKEASDYEEKLREQEREKRKASGPGNSVCERYWASLLDRATGRTDLLNGVTPSGAKNINISTDVTGIRYAIRLFQDDVRVLCLIDLKADGERRKSLVDTLHQRREDLEAAFGVPLDWLAMKSKGERRIRTCIPGGWSLAESEWPDAQDQAIDALIRLEALLREPIQTLKP
jgi:hypothetical protein